MTQDLVHLEIMEPIDLPFMNTEGEGPPGTVSWTEVTNKPAAFPPSAHTHNQTDVNGLEGDLQDLQGDIAEIDNDYDYATNIEAFLTPGL